MRIVDRVVPHASIHAQAERRWSWYDPPLAQLPTDLEDIYMPDDWWPWLTFDWDQAEPRIQQALSGDERLKEEIETGVNRYTIFACMLFQLPMVPTPINVMSAPENQEWIKATGWRHKKDKRYKLGKNGVLGLGYEKDPHNMPKMPGYKAAGIKPGISIKSARDWNARYPQLQQWKHELHRDATLQRIVRDFVGARWVLITTDADELKRQASNGPMQLGVSTMHNTMIVEVKERWPRDTILKKGKHDSLTFGIRQDVWSPVSSGIRQLVSEYVWRIADKEILIPAVFEEVFP